MSSPDIADLRERAGYFNKELDLIKKDIGSVAFSWYPYGTLNNFIHLDNLLTGDNRQILSLIGDGPVADIGGADGDLSFFLETLGYKVDLIDYGPTNYNKLQGANSLKKYLSSSVCIFEVDLDSQFYLPKNHYSMVFFLGILYHLKNPYYALEKLAKHCTYCLVSTRIAKFTPDKSITLQQSPVAYLLDPFECNNDSTNYWIFSEAGFSRIVSRTGWHILDYMTSGSKDSDPAHLDKDERLFCLLKSRFI